MLRTGSFHSNCSLRREKYWVSPDLASPKWRTVFWCWHHSRRLQIIFSTHLPTERQIVSPVFPKALLWVTRPRILEHLCTKFYLSRYLQSFSNTINRPALIVPAPSISKPRKLLFEGALWSYRRANYLDICIDIAYVFLHYFSTASGQTCEPSPAHIANWGIEFSNSWSP